MHRTGFLDITTGQQIGGCTAELKGDCGLVGGTICMRDVLCKIGKIGKNLFPVLILGETGTGKELVARCIHRLGPLRDKPFIAINCAALVPSLIEAELFGFLRGSFTGAVQDRQGLLAMARGGTIFLDEIAEMPTDLQCKLLRVLEEREFRPIGSTHSFRFGGRILAASNRDLQAAIKNGTFRQDLYFRLNAISIILPPLRKRKEDIPLLAEQLLLEIARSRAAEQSGLPWALSQEALDHLLAYNWPGNVRELRNCLEFAVTFASGPVIRASDLPAWVRSPYPDSISDFSEGVVSLEEMEQKAIQHALKVTGGKKLLAANLLGIGKTTLYRKIKKYWAI